MGVRFIGSQRYNDPELGPVRIRVLNTAKRFSARWKKHELHLTIPAGCTPTDYERVMKDFRAQLLAIKPSEKAPLYFNGFTYECHDWSFTIVADPSQRPGKVTNRRSESAGGPTFRILVSPLDDLSHPAMEKTIGRAIMGAAKYMARARLLPQAAEEALRLSLQGKVRSLAIGHGIRRFGCCKSSGDISLSAVLMFFSPEERRSTITHELAHLTHLDHSPKFYALWDQYLGYSHKLNRPDLTKLPLPVI